MQKINKEPSEMSIKELKELAKSLNIENAGTTKKDLMFSIKMWENAKLESRNVSPETLEVDMFQGKKVVKRTPIELNGVKYEDILVETGVTFREEVK